MLGKTQKFSRVRILLKAMHIACGCSHDLSGSRGSPTTTGTRRSRDARQLTKMNRSGPIRTLQSRQPAAAKTTSQNNNKNSFLTECVFTEVNILENQCFGDGKKIFMLLMRKIYRKGDKIGIIKSGKVIS